MNIKNIEEIVSWNGSWASRALFDEAVRRVVTNQPLEKLKGLYNQLHRANNKSAAKHLLQFCKVTNLNFEHLEKSTDNDIRYLFDLKQIKNIPIDLTVDYWIEKLCEHLDSSRKKITNNYINSLQEESYPNVNLKDAILNWSFPLLLKILPFPFKEIKHIQVYDTKVSNLCWKRWFCNNKLEPFIIEDSKNRINSMSQWVVWRLIHDSTHLLHLYSYPNAGSYYDPIWLMTLEGVAMTAERTVLKLIDEDFDFSPVEGVKLNTNNIKSILLMGMIERALRLEYDRDIYVKKYNNSDWVDKAKKRTGLNLDIFGFIEEFSGMPGFNAGYMLSMKAFELEKEKKLILNGSKPLDLFSFKKTDELSNSPLTDIPAKRSQFEIPISLVGTSNSTCFFNWINPFNRKKSEVKANAYLTVDLKSSQRGIHMSRIQQVLNSLSENHIWDRVEDVTVYMAKKAKLLQESRNAIAELSFESYINTFNEKSGTSSKQPVVISSRTIIEDEEITNTLSLKIKVMTACPCTVTYSRLKLLQNLRCSLQDSYKKQIEEVLPPTFTHSQPGILIVKVTSKENLISIQQIYDRVKQVSHLVESVLKRPDEHHLVEKSHTKPQFCEDLCREVANVIAPDLHANDRLEVIAELDESIHPHKAYAKINLQAFEIWN